MKPEKEDQIFEPDMTGVSDEESYKSDRSAVKVVYSLKSPIYVKMLQVIEESSNIRLSKLWKEVKEWKSSWKKITFFQALVFGLSASLFDCGTDFYFAWTVPDDCQHIAHRLHSWSPLTPCGNYHFKGVEATTYTAIALPVILLGISGIQRLLNHIAPKFFPGQTHWCIGGTASVISRAFEVLFCLILLLAAGWNYMLTNKFPKLGYIHGISIRVLACLSATFIIGVKIFGLFSHGPETSRLILRVTEMETKYEACLQLLMVAITSLTSSRATFATFLSGLSSLAIIGKVGVENLMEKHKEQVSECSLWGKIVLAAIVLPLFLLTTFFKVGTLALINHSARTIVAILGSATAGAALLILKTFYSKNDQALTSINQGIIAEFYTLHLWPKGKLDRTVGVGMATFFFLLFSSSLAWHVANPEELSKIYVPVNESDPSIQAWRSETTDRLQTISASFLGLGFITFILVICFILFQEKLVATILSNFPRKLSSDDTMADHGAESGKKKYTKDQKAEYHEEVLNLKN